ncbi:hypothetical protein M9H77_05392 [Catharanthus roseus]|uniref:Uncharacterized protein n=1 Tax=Catharanthus roseus TaxID=4058 RepID=A0ACC0CH76_CATRO|nr:hypothetical protein M9H77_05392 [Catharanthus roseus]
MDPFDLDGLKSEKATAILRCNHFKSIARLFRIMEIFFGLVFFSWTSTRLPFAVKISGEYLRQLITIIISPLFIFLVCNVIVLTLLFKAGDIFSGAQSSRSENASEIYEGFIKSSENIGLINAISSPVRESEEIEFQDKRTILEVSNSGIVSIGNSSDVTEVPETVIDEIPVLKTYQRSQSEHLATNRECLLEEENYHGKLRRSETEKCRKVGNPGEIPEKTVYIFDELSNEEFQKTIEAFIAKQIKFHQEEKLAIVLHSHMNVK